MFYIATRDNCPWCEKAEDLITYKGEPLDFLFIDRSPVARKLMLKAGLRTVPQIWKDDEYIGGYQELVAYFEQQKDETQ